jgi:hypothetical protein
MSHSHAIVWMDSTEAHIFRFNAEDVDKARIKAHRPFRKIHHKAGVVGAGHDPLDTAYLGEIAVALDGAQEWLLTGPHGAKEQLLAYVQHSPLRLKDRLFGVETLDHPTDGQLVDHARRFFKAADRMHAL